MAAVDLPLERVAWAVPELPEVETVRRGLAAELTGRQVEAVVMGAHPVVRVGTARRVYATPRPTQMLVGDEVLAVHRHGKQLAIEGRGGGAVWVHLGMSGTLRFVAGIHAAVADARLPPHTHVRWLFKGGAELRFIDPRRFGGMAAHESFEALRCARFAAAGPDALAITPALLHRKLGRTRRTLKAALLDQAVVAGLGNIYADEACHAAGLSPHRAADRVSRAEVEALVRGIRRILRRAIRLGGSTLRDHADASGVPGRAQALHRVYGRGGRPCPSCGEALERSRLAQRTTVHCRVCQR